MKKFAETVIDNNKIIIIITVILTLFFGFCLRDLKINADITSYFPKSDPVVKLFNHIGEEYGGNSLAVIALESDDIFNADSISNIHYLTTQFQSLEGVSYVTSLTNVLDIRKGEDGIEISRLIDEYNLPETPEDIKKLKKYTLSKEMYSGVLVSEDSKASLIICRLVEDVDKVVVAEQLKDIITKKSLKEKVYYGGLPFQIMDVTDIILDDLKLLIPIIVIIIAICLFLSFRTMTGMILPIISVLVSTVWTLGVMSLLDFPLTMITNAIPVILIAIGSAYNIHVINRFNEEALIDEDRVQSSVRTLSEIGVPVTLAAVTTAAGFIAFIFGSYLSMIRDFGIFSSLGVFFSLITSITFVPSVLSLLPKQNRKTESENTEHKKNPAEFFINRISSWILNNGKVIIAVFIVIIIVNAFSIPNIERKVDMLDYFEEGNSVRMTEEMMIKKFGGSIPLQILVRGDIQDPVLLEEMKKIQLFLESLGDVHNVQSVVDLIEEMSDVMDEGKNIPDSRSKISNLWFLLEGEEVMSQLVNSDKTEAVIQGTLTNVDTERIQKLVNDIENYIKDVDKKKVVFLQTGLPSIYQHLDKSIVNSQIQSLIIAIILVFICLVFLLRSFIGGIIGILPIGFTLIIIFGFMGYTGFPLDIVTVLLGSISLGIGIDYSIHFISRFKNEFDRYASDVQALQNTLQTSGKAIIINVVTVAAGFLVFILTNLVPTQRFGILVALTMITSGVCSVTLLPSIIILSKAKFVGDRDRFADKVAANLKEKISEAGIKIKKD